MKRVLLFILLTLTVVACKKVEYEPLGPTDVRIYNDTDKTFDNVVVNTSGGEHNFGTIAPGANSVYYRYEKTYPKIDVSLTIDGIEYSTVQQDYTYQNYLGQVKCTYKVFIVNPSNPSSRLLDMNVIIESPL